MKTHQVAPNLWQIALGFVNAFLLDTGDGLTLIDTGVAASAPPILDALHSLGRAPTDIRHIVVTHCHADHAGSLAALKRATNAPAIMHPLDAPLVRAGQSMRPISPAPGLANALICRFLIPDIPPEIEPAEIDIEVNDGETLPNGLRALHVPGHCAGQIALLWPAHGGTLFAADSAANAFGLALSPLYENLDEGLRSLAKLAALDFQLACFGHGRPILNNASHRFAHKWRARRESFPQTA